jgi:hypothetical protein
LISVCILVVSSSYLLSAGFGYWRRRWWSFARSVSPFFC